MHFLLFQTCLCKYTIWFCFIYMLLLKSSHIEHFFFYPITNTRNVFVFIYTILCYTDTVYDMLSCMQWSSTLYIPRKLRPSIMHNYFKCSCSKFLFHFKCMLQCHAYIDSHFVSFLCHSLYFICCIYLYYSWYAFILFTSISHFWKKIKAFIDANHLKYSHSKFHFCFINMHLCHAFIDN